LISSDSSGRVSQYNSARGVPTGGVEISDDDDSADETPIVPNRGGVSGYNDDDDDDDDDEDCLVIDDDDSSEDEARYRPLRYRAIHSVSKKAGYAMRFLGRK
jgi:hypothetical protein